MFVTAGVWKPSHELTLSFVSALGSPDCFSGSPAAPATLRLEALGKGLRVFRLGEAEHHEIPIIAA
jgi:hypothetical protein